MRICRGTLVLGLLMVLAFPMGMVCATAFAQSAGDDQYVDPFQDDTQQSEGGNGDSGSQGGSGGGDPDGSSSPPPTSEALPASETDVSDADVAAQDGSALPLTGLPLAGLVGGGMMLLAGGLALRRRV